MSERKKHKIEEELEMIEKRLGNAEEYVAKGVNVEGASSFHLGDWRGRSGHPSWMRNFMIPAMMKRRARKERALEDIDNKAKDKELMRRKRLGTRRVCQA